MDDLISRAALLEKLRELDELFARRAANEDARFKVVQVGITLASCEVEAAPTEDAEVVRHAPTVDAVNVVRCYECRNSMQIPVKHSGRIDAGEMMACRLGRGENDAISHLDIVPYDGYCDAGERKEGNDAAD